MIPVVEPTINNTLFPPIVNTYTPAFVVDEIGETCKIYFSISSYNTLAEIKNVQVTIKNQMTNLSVLDKTKYPSEIMLATLTPNTDNNYGAYYIELEKEDIINGAFEINTYYKVQLRFTGVDADNISLLTPQAIDSWLVSNLFAFSEWSTVTLVRGISKPTLSIFGYDIDGTLTTLSSANGEVFGKLTFKNKLETETLDSYKLYLYDGDTDEELFVSDLLYTSNFTDKNTFNYTLKYNLVPAKDYVIVVKYTTTNQYKGEAYSFLTVRQNEETITDINITAAPDPENGRIKIDLKRYSKIAFTMNLMIRRTSSKTNFTIWEDLFLKKYVNATTIKEALYDNTVENGVFYKYGIQIITEQSRGVLKEIKTPILALFEDMFLINKDCQLKIEFNPTIGSFKKVVSETKTDTIGSKYPFIRRGAELNYAEFPIGGFISSEMDLENVFTSNAELYKENYNLYKKFNEANNITASDNYIHEKLFKDKVISVLTSGDSFLFKSETEGNFLIRIMNISLTPNTTLGRRLWSFSATAYEIAETTIDNYLSYGIIDNYTEEV